MRSLCACRILRSWINAGENSSTTERNRKRLVVRFKEEKTMCCMPRKNKSFGQCNIRFIALSLLLCFVIASLLATTFIRIQSDHNCAKESCPVCLQTHNTRKMLEQMANAAAISIVGAGSFAAAAARAKHDFFIGCPSTLAGAKVRMNN